MLSAKPDKMVLLVANLQNHPGADLTPLHRTPCAGERYYEGFRDIKALDVR